MNRVRVWLSALALLTVAALPVAAQVQTGSILVRVNDQQGSAVPGVAVTLSSPVLVSGTMSGVTDTGGVNRFPSLQPGIYSVKLELQGFRTVVRENVQVVVGQTVPLDMPLSVATVAETVTVTGASPVVDTTTANTSVNLSEQLLQGTPGGRDIWSLVEYKVPSLLITRPDVGGTSGGLQGTFNARGTTSAQNTQLPERHQRRRSGGDRRGGLLLRLRRVRRHPGLDRRARHHRADERRVPQHGDQERRRAVARPRDLRVAGRCDADAEHRRQPAAGTASVRKPTRVDFVSDVNVSFGGPVIARKLRMFGSFRDWRVHVNTPAAFSTLVLDKTDITSGLVNANYQINDKNRLTGLYSRQYYKKPHRFLTASNVPVLESTNNEDDVFDIYQVLWNSVVTQKFFIDARVGLNKIFFPTYLNGNDQTLLDSATSIRTRNATTGTERWRDRYQANATGQYYVDEVAGRPARIQVRLRLRALAGREPHEPLRRCRHDLQQQRPALAQNVTLFATPFYTKTAVDVIALYAQDSISRQAPDGHGRPALGAPGRLSARSRAARRAASSRLCRAASRSVDDVVELEDGGPAPERGLRPDGQWPHRR